MLRGCKGSATVRHGLDLKLSAGPWPKVATATDIDVRGLLVLCQVTKDIGFLTVPLPRLSRALLSADELWQRLARMVYARGLCWGIFVCPYTIHVLHQSLFGPWSSWTFINEAGGQPHSHICVSVLHYEKHGRLAQLFLPPALTKVAAECGTVSEMYMGHGSTSDRG